MGLFFGTIFSRYAREMHVFTDIFITISDCNKIYAYEHVIWLIHVKDIRHKQNTKYKIQKHLYKKMCQSGFFGLVGVRATTLEMWHNVYLKSVMLNHKQNKCENKNVLMGSLLPLCCSSNSKIHSHTKHISDTQKMSSATTNGKFSWNTARIHYYIGCVLCTE